MKKTTFISLLVLIGFFVYFNSLFNNFVWDDEEQILNNYLVHSLKNLPSFFTGSTFNPGGAPTMGGMYYKPLMMVCFSILYSLFGHRPFFFHLFQVSLHIVNSILVFLLFDYFFNRFNQLGDGRLIVGNQEEKVSGKGTGIAFFLSLIFLVHPQNAEAVVYISDLQDVLFFFFGMLGLLIITTIDSFASFSPTSAHSNNFSKIDTPKLQSEILFQKKISESKNLRACRNPSTGATCCGFFIVVFFIFLSLLSKETGVIFVFIILFYLFLFKREKLASYLIFSSMTVWLYGLLRFVVAGILLQKHGLSPITRMGFWQRMVSVPQIIFFYLKTFFYPKDLAINQHWVVEKIGWLDFYFPLIFVIIFFFLLIIIGLTDFPRPWQNGKWARRIFLFFFLWFVASLGFHLHFFPLDLTVSDRWFYLPMVGLLGMIGVILSRQRKFLGEVNSLPDVPSGPLAPPSTSKIEGSVVNRWLKQLTHRKNFVVFLKYGSVILIIVFLSIRTIIRTFYWRNGLTLYSHDIKISKNAFDLENNLGVELFRAGKIDQAKIHFENSAKLAPFWWTNWNNLGAVYERKGDFKKAEEYYKKAIDNSDYYLAFEN